MNRKEQVKIDHERKRQEYFLRLLAGLRNLLYFRHWLFGIVAAYLLTTIVVWQNRERLLFGIPDTSPLHPVFVLSLDGSMILLGILGLGLLLLAFGTPIRAKTIQNKLVKAGFVNHLNEPPLLLTRYKKAGCKYMEFDTNALPFSQWKNSANEIGAALGCIVADAQPSKNGKRIILKVAPMRSSLPERIFWKKEYLYPGDFVLVLGKNLMGHLETFDLATTPHLLIGGGTGSGKSILLKCLLMQSLCKDATVYIADFKHGVDFSPVWHERCEIVFDLQSLLIALENLTSELERRRGIFVAAGTPNLTEYNKTTCENLHRCVLACDEIAEVLDKTGMSKTEKEIVGQIVRHLSLIARQGRAFGLHLFLATQRPSADLIPGQIRTNLTLRICGRADDILSRIILDDATAAEQIPLNAQGRFVSNMGQGFQGFLFDEQSI